MNFIDLFSGAGGLSEGFVRSGFSPIAHVEMDKASCNTLLTRTAYYYLLQIDKIEIYKNYLLRKITRNDLYNYLPDKLKKSVINKVISFENNNDIFNEIDILKGATKVDLIIGGPPCQAYSLSGRARDKDGMKNDSRNYLYIQYAEFLKKYKPKIFVFENVLGLLSAKDKSGHKYFDKMLDLFHGIGYKVEYKLLNANDFGVLQSRRRIIIIGRKGKKGGFYPKFIKQESIYTVEEIFKGLPKLCAGEGSMLNTRYTNDLSNYLQKTNILSNYGFTTEHVARPNNNTDKEIYRIAVNKWNETGKRLNYNDLPNRLKNHKNMSSFADRFKVVASNLNVAQTVVAHIAKDGHYYIHPDIDQNRSISPREAARLQSFPDNYFFEGISDKPSRTSVYQQIGNAVPPLMAEQIAKQIKKILK